MSRINSIDRVRRYQRRDMISLLQITSPSLQVPPVIRSICGEGPGSYQLNIY